MNRFCSEDFVEGEKVRIYLDHGCSDLQVREGVVWDVNSSKRFFGLGSALQLLVERAGCVNSGEVDMSFGPYRSSGRRIRDENGDFIGNLRKYKQKFFYHTIVAKDRLSR